MIYLEIANPPHNDFLVNIIAICSQPQPLVAQTLLYLDPLETVFLQHRLNEILALRTHFFPNRTTKF